MAKHKTPGVYIQEASSQPPSVAEVKSAVPAFIGYTGKATAKTASDLYCVPKKIFSFIEYLLYFGEPQTEMLEIDVSGVGATYTVDSFKPPTPNYLLYYSLKMYFDNGGGPCYVVSVGVPPKPVTKDGLSKGLEALKPVDEITLVVIPDATRLSYGDYAQLARAEIKHCSDLKHCFAILDVWHGDLNPDDPIDIGTVPGVQGALMDANRAAWTGDLKYAAAYYLYLMTSLNYNFTTKPDRSISNVIVAFAGTRKDLCGYKKANPALYECVVSTLKSHSVIVPPSGAVAGVYCSVDKSRGVWKAPANVALASVIEPLVKINDTMQESLNVDTVSGKSVNVIRTFVGKGVLVWGSRTLAGNDDEWRYIPVRRFFSMVEESVTKSTEWVVFEPNDANTWLKVRAMIENYLTQKWREGALVGTKPEEAFFARCGLGVTMTAQDILEGRMIIEIGLAAMRPAEFIILKFSHKMQVS